MHACMMYVCVCLRACERACVRVNIYVSMHSFFSLCIRTYISTHVCILVEPSHAGGRVSSYQHQVLCRYVASFP